MAIASVLVQTTNENTERIKQQLQDCARIESVSPKGEIILLLEADNLDALHACCLQLEQIDGVSGVFPTYVTTADEEA